jgi:lipopolysaccharide export system protein LptC
VNGPGPFRRAAQKAVNLCLDVGNWLILYLPVLLMGVLAFLTYGLLRNTPQTEAPMPELAPRHAPDYTMGRVVLQQFQADGRPRARLQALEVRHYPDTQTLRFEQPVLLWHTPQGDQTSAQAAQGESNADGSEVRLWGDVRIARTAAPRGETPAGPGWVVQTQSLFLDARRERMSTDQPVQLQRGNDRMAGQRLQYDHLTQQLDLSGKVRMSITPTGRGPGELKISTPSNRP